MDHMPSWKNVVTIILLGIVVTALILYLSLNRFLGVRFKWKTGVVEW
jgi:hypothetical protein